MLGRFLCQNHPVSFWKSFGPSDIAFLLNEYVLFEKYMQVLYEFGERHLNRIKNKILTDDLNTITLSKMNTDTFLTLKLCSFDWEDIETRINPEHEKDTRTLIRTLKQPYGVLVDYNLPWSFEKLQAVCDAEKLETPSPNAI